MPRSDGPSFGSGYQAPGVWKRRCALCEGLLSLPRPAQPAETQVLSRDHSEIEHLNSRLDDLQSQLSSVLR